MTVSAQQIANLYGQRRTARGPELARMAEVQQMYDGAIVVPLPELNRNERDSVPNRVREGLKQFSQRIASAVPDIWTPTLRPGIKLSEDRAHDRRRALYGWWGASRMRILLRQRARYLQGYGAAPSQIRWDTYQEIPRYEARNPLATYPSLLRGPEEMCPADCIVETVQTLRWLQTNYPAQTALLSKTTKHGELDYDCQYTLLEYSDAEECVLVALGHKGTDSSPPPGSMAVELERYPNRAGRCPYVIPRTITLSQPHGQFDGMYGMHQTEAMLTALSIIATKKGVFADEWLVAHPGEEPIIEQVPNNSTGEPGIVKGGQLVQRGVDPQFQTNISIDRLAATQMQTAGLSSELSGLAPTNVRTGVRAQNLLANVIDFPIQEGQELFAESLAEENKIAIAYAKAYGGTKSFYVNWEGARGPVTYKPDDTFETDENIVRYAMTGADQAGLVISGGQRVQMGTMSHRRFMQLDPLIDDPEREHDLIIGERLEQAVLAGIEQHAASGQMPPTFVAKIAELVVSNEAELFEAVNRADEAAKQLQAQQAPPGAPETQPGLQGPNAAQGGQQAPPDLATLLASLRRPQTGVSPQEQLAAGPAA